MAKTYPWHSNKHATHHNDTKCGTGSAVEPEHLRYGTGNRPLCRECARLKWSVLDHAPASLDTRMVAP